MEPTTIGKTRHDRGDDPARSPPRRRGRLSLEVSTWPQFDYPAGTDQLFKRNIRTGNEYD